MPVFIFHLLTVMDEHLWVVTRQEGSKTDNGGVLKLDSRVGRESGHGTGSHRH